MPYVAYSTSLLKFLQKERQSVSMYGRNSAIYYYYMHHEPENYLCPFCDWLAGNETEYKQNSDIVFQDDVATAFISPKWWVNNPGHVIIISNQHVKNLYDIDDETLSHITKIAKRVAIAVRKTYAGCAGISTRQHNEPDGNQDVWHFHTHIFPRFPGDSLYKNHQNKYFVTVEKRKPYADKLRKSLNS